MKSRFVVSAALCAVLSACAISPASDPVPGTAVADPEAPSSPGESTDASRQAAEALEGTHRERALAYVRTHNWADALVQWELLTVLNPRSQEYRSAIAETRARIHTIASDLLNSAARARQTGNLDQATVLYLRVLNVDRENAVAAQALRDIDAERTRRAYLTRPPRGAY